MLHPLSGRVRRGQEDNQETDGVRQGQHAPSIQQSVHEEIKERSRLAAECQLEIWTSTARPDVRAVEGERHRPQYAVDTSSAVGQHLRDRIKGLTNGSWDR